jgi:hypothetical protein
MWFAKSWLPLEKREAEDKRWRDGGVLLCEEDRRSGVRGGDDMLPAYLCTRVRVRMSREGCLDACWTVVARGGVYWLDARCFIFWIPDATASSWLCYRVVVRYWCWLLWEGTTAQQQLDMYEYFSW